MEYMVQYRNWWDDRLGRPIPDGPMPLGECRKWIAEHPGTEYNILHRDASDPAAIWSVMPTTD